MTLRRKTWTPLSFDKVRTTSLFDRTSKDHRDQFARPWQPGGGFRDFLRGLPDILAGSEFTAAVAAICRALRADRAVLLGMGAHPIKVGLNPVLIDALENGILSALALNGAGIIHDVELALAGRTSEEVADQLPRGEFGMAGETAAFIHAAVADGFRTGGVGLGRAVGRRLLARQPPGIDLSLLAAAARLDAPVTVHVAIGTDIIHMHPGMDGAAMGALSYHDFRLFSALVSSLEGGVYINLGSAVVLPEVFLKAVSVVTNLGYSLDGITTINMDFQRHYRPQVNVTDRPTAGRGRGITLIGHHEIMFPLLLAAVKERLSEEDIRRKN